MGKGGKVRAKLWDEGSVCMLVADKTWEKPGYDATAHYERLVIKGGRERKGSIM